MIDIATRNAPKSTPAPAQKPADKPADVDDAMTALRKEYATRGREKLRTKVLPELEMVIHSIPSGRQRNMLTDANVILLKVLDELQS